ncbi:hypothetical protein PHSY_002561 [Pseudozyma hubeiensis SY62]|uniref:Uncharacterized protein n=1 Tax=Pseudozyma hubeiensis (strain SY62) TaxID=1305764 RepID=R9P139_PSEHS|nr:hypothetical protein PHSY_002561 [Pseudozyma hubeiensis SY62]GAC94988.1 hypothetical protein PHSY_002561 [Pseudozyma hubeiensis SY62]
MLGCAETNSYRNHTPLLRFTRAQFGLKSFGARDIAGIKPLDLLRYARRTRRTNRKFLPWERHSNQTGSLLPHASPSAAS